MERKKISLCMIVKNEEKNIRRCLESVQGIVDEMVIVDTGSTDKTIEIARSFGAKIIQVPWEDDFSKARNASLDAATGEWFLIMDADDQLASGDKDRVRKLAENPEVEAYFFETLSYVGERAGIDVIINLNIRLVRNRKEYRFSGRIHEQLVISIMQNRPGAKMKTENIKVYHYGYLDTEVNEKEKRQRNIAILEKQLAEYPEDYFSYFNMGNEYFALGDYREALKYYHKAYDHLVPYMGFTSKLFIRMVMSLDELGEYEKALALIDEGLRYYPEYTDLVFFKGSIYHKQGRFSLALQAFEKCLEMGEAPPHVAFVAGVGTYRPHYALGEIYMQLQDWDKANHHYNMSLKIAPQFSKPVYRVAEILFQQEEGKALQQLKSYFDLSIPYSFAIIADILFTIGRYQLALDHLNQALEKVEPNDQLRFFKGRCLFNLGRWEEAQEEFKKIQAGSKQFSGAAMLGFFCGLLAENQEAVQYYLSLAEKDSVNEVPFAVLSRIEKIAQGQTDGLEDIPQAQRDEAIEFIFKAFDRLLTAKAFDLFEKILPVLNYLSEEKVLLRLGKLYYRHNFSALAKAEIIRSLKVFNCCDAEGAEILMKILDCEEKGKVKSQ